jgi:hypothetical protein
LLHDISSVVLSGVDSTGSATKRAERGQANGQIDAAVNAG